MRVARYNEEIREVGKYSVNIVGRNFTVVVTRIRVTLECKIKDDSEVKRVIEALRSRYGEIIIHT